MLIARAPLRLSFAGGGTDLPAYYEQYGGDVVSTTIDKYVYVHVRPNGPDSVQIASADYRAFFRHQHGAPMGWNGELALPRAVLHEFGVERGVNLFLASEVPPGTGLGSSSAIAAASIQAVATYQGRPLAPQQVAELACHIELNKLAAPIGKQDQFAAAFGGLNAIHFGRAGVTVEPLAVPPATLERLERRLLLFFTGSARDSAVILKEQQRASARREGHAIESLHRIRAAALTCRRYLESGDLDGIGQLLDDGWREKKRLAAGISNVQIDTAYAVAQANGAVGGKITGAGGGGFLLLYCPLAAQPAVTAALGELGLARMDFHFERHGVEVVDAPWGDARPHGTVEQGERLLQPV